MLRALRAALNEQRGEAPRDLLSLLRCDAALDLSAEVGLVPDEHHLVRRRRVRLEFAHPRRFQILERLRLCDVVDEDRAVNVSVETLCESPEALLTGRVPDSELDRLTIALDKLLLVLDADGRVLVREQVLAVAEHDRRLPDGAVAEQDDLVLDRVLRGLLGHLTSAAAGYALKLFMVRSELFVRIIGRIRIDNFANLR